MAGRCLLLQCLVRALVVVFFSEVIKGLLLSEQRTLWWFGGFGFQSPMHPFVTAILGRFA